ncbi:phosphatidylinositol N-acetylglucosaminyltransferase subunit A [Pancytospora philotis]|nr:phosphatidylinositol N-acetylglucosaminyltransferase subunit A [Pancytospora philotis]
MRIKSTDAPNPGMYNIALVTDYFYPNTGGIETHVRTIGEELCNAGHSVIVITHKYKHHEGLMQIGPLLVYYLDLPVVACNTVFPTLFGSYVLYKEIFERHRIDIVHGHQSLSTMCNEAIYHASHLGIRTVMTDHSVFEFGKIERILCDSLSYLICKSLDRAICVSNTARLNTAKRTCLPLGLIRVIPNGVDPRLFYPKQAARTGRIRVLFCARLVFRKGIDLLAEALPLICKDPRIEVVIVGDGPKRDDVMQIVDEAELHEQVKILGEMNYREIPDVMRSADIFLNTSLTETFCTSILEAAACGLLVVSTNVGGIHEVLDDGVIYFCKPTPRDIAAQIFSAAGDLRHHRPDKHYQKIFEKYDWKMIAEQTRRVYDEIPERSPDMRTALRAFVHRSGFFYRFLTWLEYAQHKLLGALNIC